MLNSLLEDRAFRRQTVFNCQMIEALLLIKNLSFEFEIIKSNN